MGATCLCLFVHFVLFSLLSTLDTFLRNIRSSLESSFQRGQKPLRVPFRAVVLLLDPVYVEQWSLVSPPCPLPPFVLLG